jgi:hypothetical protein
MSKLYSRRISQSCDCQISRAHILDYQTQEWDPDNPEMGTVLSSHPFTPIKIRSHGRVSMEVRISSGEATKIIAPVQPWRTKLYTGGAPIGDRTNYEGPVRL